jgi:hypothetical protein
MASASLESHTPLATVGVFILLGNLEFAINRLTISASATCSS